jgi:hypothetical protein
MTVAALRVGLVVVSLAGLIGMAAPATALQGTPAAPSAAPGDGQHDFDWEIGNWATHVRVLRNPLSGAAPDWAEFRGTSLVKPILGGRANSVELSVKNDKSAIEGVSLRLYNPQARQWSLNYATVRGGVLTAPVYGSFDGKGRGQFHGQDMLDGRAIMVRFVISPVSPNEARFEQYYSADGGASWELNWVAVDTRLPN